MYDSYQTATQLKPDEGTPELPYGKVRVRLHTDGSVHDVAQYEIEKVNLLLCFLFWSNCPILSFY